MDLIEDKMDVVQEGKEFVVTRTIVEKYDAEEYTRTCKSMAQAVEQLETKEKDTMELLEKFGVLKEVAEKVREAEIKQGQQDLKKITEKLNEQKNQQKISEQQAQQDES